MILNVWEILVMYGATKIITDRKYSNGFLTRLTNNENGQETT